MYPQVVGSSYGKQNTRHSLRETSTNPANLTKQTDLKVVGALDENLVVRLPLPGSNPNQRTAAARALTEGHLGQRDISTVK